MLPCAQAHGADSPLLPGRVRGGEVIHAFGYTTAKEYVGKKVIVVGAATSGHDVAFDLANHGIGQ